MHPLSPDEFARLVDRHGPTLALYARLWCMDADDAVQEAFLELVKRTRPPVEPLPWLFATVRNRARSLARTQRRAERRERDLATQQTPWFEPDPSARLDAQAATEALAELELVEREAVVARLWGELTFEQLGQLLGMSRSAAHRVYEAALARLRRRLDPNTITVTEGDVT